MESHPARVGEESRVDLPDDELAELRQLGIDPVLARQAGDAYDRVCAAIREKRDPSAADAALVEQFLNHVDENDPVPDDHSFQDAAQQLEREQLRACARKLQELLDSLPPHFASLSHFASMTPVPIVVRHSFLEEEDTKAMGAMGEKFATIGMRPADLMESIHGMQMLVERIMHHGAQSPHLQSDGTIHISPELMLCEIRTGALNSEAVEPIRQWLFDILRIRPTFLKGFHAEVKDAELLLQAIPDRDENE